MRKIILPHRAYGAAVLLLLAGCASQQTATKPDNKERTGGHWVQVDPKLGSNVPRRVWVKDDGTVEEEKGSQVIELSGEDAKKAVRRH
jgi:hypothetical protein